MHKRKQEPYAFLPTGVEVRWLGGPAAFRSKHLLALQMNATMDQRRRPAPASNPVAGPNGPESLHEAPTLTQRDKPPYSNKQQAPLRLVRAQTYRHMSHMSHMSHMIWRCVNVVSIRIES